VALVLHLGQIRPGSWRAKAVLLGLDGVEADCGHPGVHTRPVRRVALVLELGIQLVQANRGVWLQHAFLFHQQQAGGGQAPDDIGLGVVFLGQQLGGDDTSGIPHPLDLDVGIVLVETGGVLLEVLGFHRRIDRKGFRPWPTWRCGY
jgi:hypothetical protein